MVQQLFQAQMRQTNDARASIYIASSIPKKGNNAKTPAICSKSRWYFLSHLWEKFSFLWIAIKTYKNMP